MLRSLRSLHTSNIAIASIAALVDWVRINEQKWQFLLVFFSLLKELSSVHLYCPKRGNCFCSNAAWKHRYINTWMWESIFLLMLITAPALQALKSSTEVELVDDRVRCKTEPERWPIPVPPIVGSPRTDFSQLINCPEFVPRQTLSSTNSGQCSTLFTV